MDVSRVFVGVGALSGLLAVAAGAFGAHGLRDRLTPDLLQVFELGVRYQMYHALALVAAGLAAGRWGGGAITTAGWLFMVGTLIFSGSLYVLALTGQKWLGAITPLGGLAFLGGWAALAWAAFRS